MMAGFGLKLLSEQDILLMCWAGLVLAQERKRDQVAERGQGGGEGGRREQSRKWELRNTETKSWLGLKWQECRRWICQQFWCFDSSRLFSLSLYSPPPLCELASWPDNSAQLHPQLCVGPRKALLFISLIGHIWHHYFHLGVVQLGGRDGGCGGGAGYCWTRVGQRWCGLLGA